MKRKLLISGAVLATVVAVVAGYLTLMAWGALSGLDETGGALSGLLAVLLTEDLRQVRIVAAAVTVASLLSALAAGVAARPRLT